MLYEDDMNKNKLNKCCGNWQSCFGPYLELLAYRLAQLHEFAL